MKTEIFTLTKNLMQIIKTKHINKTSFPLQKAIS
jgi:hypothetical protein